GKMTISVTNTEYKTFNGVKLPVKLVMDTGQFKINTEISETKVNQGLTLDAIK
ncbi:MAG: hypothetical protein IM587_08275, partial [Chitinophagaceae bacterium]|nr:hypothetical protein [Chitinophagaceae bacterium]